KAGWEGKGWKWTQDPVHPNRSTYSRIEDIESLKYYQYADKAHRATAFVGRPAVLGAGGSLVFGLSYAIYKGGGVSIPGSPNLSWLGLPGLEVTEEFLWDAGKGTLAIATAVGIGLALKSGVVAAKYQSILDGLAASKRLGKLLGVGKLLPYGGSAAAGMAVSYAHWDISTGKVNNPFSEEGGHRLETGALLGVLGLRWYRGKSGALKKAFGMDRPLSILAGSTVLADRERDKSLYSALDSAGLGYLAYYPATWALNPGRNLLAAVDSGLAIQTDNLKYDERASFDQAIYGALSNSKLGSYRAGVIGGVIVFGLSYLDTAMQAATGSYTVRVAANPVTTVREFFSFADMLRQKIKKGGGVVPEANGVQLGRLLGGIAGGASGLRSAASNIRNTPAMTGRDFIAGIHETAAGLVKWNTLFAVGAPTFLKAAGLSDKEFSRQLYLTAYNMDNVVQGAIGASVIQGIFKAVSASPFAKSMVEGFPGSQFVKNNPVAGPGVLMGAGAGMYALGTSETARKLNDTGANYLADIGLIVAGIGLNRAVHNIRANASFQKIVGDTVVSGVKLGHGTNIRSSDFTKAVFGEGKAGAAYPLAYTIAGAVGGYIYRGKTTGMWRDVDVEKWDSLLYITVGALMGTAVRHLPGMARSGIRLGAGAAEIASYSAIGYGAKKFAFDPFVSVFEAWLDPENKDKQKKADWAEASKPYLFEERDVKALDPDTGKVGPVKTTDMVYALALGVS
ncbi:MAG: hypothetical protein AAB834_05240, partial [Patescibacteria group bacterium]